MGWKLAIAAAPMDGRTLDEAVAQIYGRPVALSASDVTVNDALYPSDLNARFAASLADFAWVFDWRLVEAALGAPDKYRGGASDFFYLQSTVNAYGFAERRNGAFQRVRLGSGDDGVIVDLGEASAAERAAVAAVASPGAAIESWSAWCDADRSFQGVDYEFTHDGIGEEVVFALMGERLGFRFDAPEPHEAFCAQEVMRVR